MYPDEVVDGISIRTQRSDSPTVEEVVQLLTHVATYHAARTGGDGGLSDSLTQELFFYASRGANAHFESNIHVA
jgi:hypothetical protein